MPSRDRGTNTMNEADFDERDRERNAEISRDYGNALVRELREVYGQRFAAGHADTSTLREVINRLDRTSLSELHRDHATGRLHAKANSATALWDRRPL
jgi:hypothetical protein